MVPNPVYVLKIDKLEVVPPQAQSSAFVLKPCPALSHIQKVIFPEAEVPPIHKEAHVVREWAWRISKGASLQSSLDEKATNSP